MHVPELFFAAEEDGGSGGGPAVGNGKANAGAVLDLVGEHQGGLFLGRGEGGGGDDDGGFQVGRMGGGNGQGGDYEGYMGSKWVRFE